MSLPIPTPTHSRACPLSDRSPVGDASPGRIMHSIHPSQSQYHVHSRPPPPSNSTASSSSRPPPPHQSQQNTRDPVSVIGVPSVTVEYNQLVVGDARTCAFIPHASTRFQTHSHSPPFPSLSFSFFFSQHPHAHTLLSKSSAMGRLEPSGCVIGMGPYPPIHLCPPCSAAQVHVQSMPTSVS